MEIKKSSFWYDLLFVIDMNYYTRGFGIRIDIKTRKVQKLMLKDTWPLKDRHRHFIVNLMLFIIIVILSNFLSPARKENVLFAGVGILLGVALLLYSIFSARVLLKRLRSEYQLIERRSEYDALLEVEDGRTEFCIKFLCGHRRVLLVSIYRLFSRNLSIQLF